MVADILLVKGFVFSQVVLTFRCSPNFYRDFIQDFSKIAASLTSMLKTSSLIDSSTNITQIVFEYDGADDSGGHSGDFDVIFQVTRWRAKIFHPTFHLRA